MLHQKPNYTLRILITFFLVLLILIGCTPFLLEADSDPQDDNTLSNATLLYFDPDGILSYATLDGSNPQSLADDLPFTAELLNEGIYPAYVINPDNISTGGRWLAFNWNWRDNWQLIDLSDPQSRTKYEGHWLSWSPEGRTAAYELDNALCLMDVEREESQCFDALERGIVKITGWSPQGQYLTQVTVFPEQATQTNGVAEVTVYDAHTNNMLTQIVTTVPFEITGYDVYRWAQDDSSLLVSDSSKQQIHVYTPDENDVQIMPIAARSISPNGNMLVDWQGQLVPVANHRTVYPLVLPCPEAAKFLWSSDSTFLAYTSRCSDSEESTLYVVEVETGRLITQVVLPTANSEPVSWTPDKEILIRSGTSGNIADYSIWKISLLSDTRPESVLENAFLLGLIPPLPE